MQALTHLSFAMITSTAVGAVIGHPLTPAEAVWAAAGSLLPDIDTPTSLVGKVCPPLSQWLERHWGHREVTHSLLAVAVITLVTVPVALQVGYGGWATALVIGYLSHLLLDANTKSGVKLFHPSAVRAVIPGKENLRIASGSIQERILCVAFVVVLVVLLPINLVGIRPALHRVLQTTSAAISDYRTWGGEHRVFAKVEGRFQISQRPVSGVLEVLGIANANMLVALDRATGRIFSIGTDKNANIYPTHIYCWKGERVSIRVQEVLLDNELLTEALSHLPTDGETFIEGEAKTLDQVLVSQPPDVWTAIEPGVRSIRLRYARPEDLRRPELEGVFVTQGHLYVRTVQTVKETDSSHGRLSASAAAVQGEATQPEFTGVVDVYINHVRDMEREILIRRGEQVLKGQMLALLTYRDQEIKRQEHALADEIAAGEAKIAEVTAMTRLARQQASIKVSEAMGEVDTIRREWGLSRRLYRAGAFSSAHVEDQSNRLAVVIGRVRLAHLSVRAASQNEMSNLRQAQTAVAQARRGLEAVQEAWESTRIRAPADGKVLLVRPHVVNNQDMTVLIRLLVKHSSRSRRPAGTVTPHDPSHTNPIVFYDAMSAAKAKRKS